MSHSLYSIKRKAEFIENVNFMYENNDLNTSNYQAKLLGLFQAKHDENLGMELLLNDNYIFSLSAPISKVDRVYSTISVGNVNSVNSIHQHGSESKQDSDDNDTAPVFYHINQTRWRNGLKRFVASLVHYSELVYNNQENEDDKEFENIYDFGQRYFSNKCAVTLENNKNILFWGRPVGEWEVKKQKHDENFDYLLKYSIMQITV